MMLFEKESLMWRRNAEEGESKLEEFKETVRQLELEVSTLQQTNKVLWMGHVGCYDVVKYS
jgi:predicted nuclease with TOPRIM domain